MSNIENIVITIKDLPHYKCDIKSNSIDMIEIISKHLSIKEERSFINPRVKWKKMWIKSTHTTKMFTDYTYIDKDKINRVGLVVRRGLIDHVLSKIDFLKMNNSSIEVIYERESDKIKIIPKWIEIFKSHPKGLEVGLRQLSDTMKLLQNNNGTAELFTGAGKTEMIIGISESYMTQHPDSNVLILVPLKAIGDEISIRMKRYGVDHHVNYVGESGISIINPIGYMSSGAPKDEKIIRRSKKIGLMITDESHHASANSYFKIVDELLENIRFSYGFSGSADSRSGNEISVETSPQDLGANVCRVISLTGPSRIRRDPVIQLELIRIYTKLADKRDNKSKSVQTDFNKDNLDVSLSEDEIMSIINGAKDSSNDKKSDSWISRLDESLISTNIVPIIAFILKNNPDRLFYMPVHKKDSGKQLHAALQAYGIPGVYWDSNTLTPPLIDDAYGTDKNMGILDRMKKVLGNPDTPFRYLISTTVGFEGIDIPRLNAIIPLTGTSFRTIVQPIGRSARGHNVLVVLLFDSNNRILYTQSESRYKTILKTYNVIYDRKINIKDQNVNYSLF